MQQVFHQEALVFPSHQLGYIIGYFVSKAEFTEDFTHGLFYCYLSNKKTQYNETVGL